MLFFTFPLEVKIHSEMLFEFSDVIPNQFPQSKKETSLNFSPKIEHHGSSCFRSSGLYSLQSWFIIICKLYTDIDSSLFYIPNSPNMFLKLQLSSWGKGAFPSWLLGLQHPLQGQNTGQGLGHSFAYQEGRTQDSEILPFILQLPCCKLSGTLPHIHAQT